MGRGFFTTEFKHEAVKLVQEPGMAVGHAAKDLGCSDLVMRSCHGFDASWPRRGLSETS